MESGNGRRHDVTHKSQLDLQHGSASTNYTKAWPLVSCHTIMQSATIFFIYNLLHSLYSYSYSRRMDMDL
jgi:hypothetical protein